MKISDYIIDFVADLGVDRIFCVTGGGAMYMNNSLGQSDKVEDVARALLCILPVI